MKCDGHCGYLSLCYFSDKVLLKLIIFTENLHQAVWKMEFSNLSNILIDRVVHIIHYQLIFSNSSKANPWLDGGKFKRCDKALRLIVNTNQHFLVMWLMCWVTQGQKYYLTSSALRHCLEYLHRDSQYPICKDFSPWHTQTRMNWVDNGCPVQSCNVYFLV